ncbi:MAG TPA: hypothetical protein VFZ89_03735 [Solirubrobacteraceae bacterium]
MSRAEAHSWWDDVQHLKPEAAAAPSMRLVDTEEPLRDAAEASATRRRARLSEGSEPCLSRSDAADFADAFDLDGAFGAPRRRFARGPQIQDTDEGPVIVLERSAPTPEPERASDTSEFEPVAEAPDTSDFEAVDPALDAAIGEPPARDPETGRRVVQISGRPEGQVAPRRLREIESRRPRRSVAERAMSSPDRVALYAVLLGLFLVIIAAASAGPQP